MGFLAVLPDTGRQCFQGYLRHAIENVWAFIGLVEFRVWGLGFRVLGLGFRAFGLLAPRRKRMGFRAASMDFFQGTTNSVPMARAGPRPTRRP